MMLYSRARSELRGGACFRESVCVLWVELSIAAGLLVVLLCGCKSSSPDTMANAYYLNKYEDLRDLGQVALVELDNASAYPEISRDVTKALFLELQKKQVFSVTTVARDDPAWRALQENLNSHQAMQALLAIRENLKVNGLLVGTVTEHRPYPRLAVGLRLKLLDLTDGQLLWGVDQVWDSTDRDVQKRIRTYFRKELRSASGTSPLSEELVAISPLEFLKYAAHEVAQTLDAADK
jgi:hypothetical protein